VQNPIEIGGGKNVSRVFEGDRRFDVVVRLPKNRSEIDAIRSLPVPLQRRHCGHKAARTSACLSPKPRSSWQRK
jgi:cobalt-zinc-cadmium resistance protein CzcA